MWCLKKHASILALAFVLVVPMHQAYGNVAGEVRDIMSTAIIYQTPWVDISATDISRGYVEVPDATVIEIMSASRKGYYLVFEGHEGPFSNVLIIDGNSTTSLAGGTGSVQQSVRYDMSGEKVIKAEKKILSYRFFLADNVVPGSYPLWLNVYAVPG